MSVGEQLDALRRELMAAFPDDRVTAATLEPTLVELERALASEDLAAADVALDLLEDLLEARMQEAGWPSLAPARARGAT